MKRGNNGSAFFHTLVIMGGSLAGCGGQAQEGSHGDGDAAGDGGASGGMPTSTGGALVGSGGGTPVSTGGAWGDGDGDIIISTGGSSAAGGNYMGGAHGLGCPPEQWECGEIRYDCTWHEFEILDHCTCDDSRPIVPADCPAGTILTCMEGVEYDEDFNGTVQAFSCSCLEERETCRQQCEGFGISYGDCYDPTADFQGYLCGCEIPVLR